jgi:hypothetical protein
MAVALFIPTTDTGVLAEIVVPLPSWPELLSPQHCTSPLASKAQLWLPPVVTAVAVLSPVTDTGTSGPGRV